MFTAKNLEISNSFTIDDIHKVREANYERQKHMSDKEVIADNRKRLDAIKADLKEKGITGEKIRS